MSTNILQALKAIDVSTLSRADWIAVGMALKEEGFPCSIWDDWSQNDDRYHPGECEKQWESFKGSGTPVTGGTIIQMAKERGFDLSTALDCPLSWDDTIEYDGDDGFTGFAPPSAWSPTEDLITYLETLFDLDDIVGYVTGDVWQNSDGKWVPSKGVFRHTAGELIRKLRKYKDDIGATVGDWKEEAGAWIRFNPLDGEGVKNDNVTKFKYALVESDSLSLKEQDALFRKYELPIAALVHSGKKSLHAIVRIDAKDYAEYRQRVEFLYDFLADRDVVIDTQNRNPSRLSRMPGITRNGQRQYLVDTNVGRKSWNDWMDYVEGVTDELPDMVSLAEYKDNQPPLPEELIKGILRRGHKMLISGSSKAGKSFLLMELCAAIASGTPWLGFECKQGKVLYINLEIDPASCIDRFMRIFRRHRIDFEFMDNITIWNLRGHAVPLDLLVPKLIRRVRDRDLDAIILDPIYKVITGDENNASEMGAFCNQFDKICTETGCSAIYCHHHSKSAQNVKNAMYRASGSGVFSRDPDAQLDMVELELSDDIRNNLRDGDATAWRLESSLREFKNIKPVHFWFDYPIHRLDTTGELSGCPLHGSMEAGRQKAEASNARKKEDADDRFRNAFNALNMDGTGVHVKDMMSYLDVGKQTVYNRVTKLNREFKITNGIVTEIDDSDDGEN
jgi:RecA-family ATPase